VALNGRTVKLAPVARRRMEASRKVVLRKIAEGEHLYGITTGFGKLSDRFIPSADQPPAQPCLRCRRTAAHSRAAGLHFDPRKFDGQGVLRNPPSRRR